MPGGYGQIGTPWGLGGTTSTPGPYVGVYDVTDTTARISFTDNSTDEDGFKIYIHDASDVFDATQMVELQS